MLNKTRNAPPLAAHEKLVVQDLKDELLIYNLQTNQAIALNQTAALVWRYCDGKRDISEITRKLEEKLGASANYARFFCLCNYIWGQCRNCIVIFPVVFK